MRLELDLTLSVLLLLDFFNGNFLSGCHFLIHLYFFFDGLRVLLI